MRLFGHPVHPMLVHLPIALWTLGTACDGLTLAGVGEAWPLAGLCMALGLGLALPAMGAGLLDFASLPDRAVGTATRHMVLMGMAWSAYLAAVLMRSDGLGLRPEPAPAAMVVGLAGFLLLAAGAAQGGQLVYRLGVGVDRAEAGPPEA